MSGIIGFPQTRLRRLRYNSTVRSLVCETRLNPCDFILPLFIHHEKGTQHPIKSMPGYHQFSIDKLDAEIDEVLKLGIPGVLLFGIPSFKDPEGSASWQADGVIQQAIRYIKEKAPSLLVIADLCFCEYTDHGHCGIISPGNDNVHNDDTLKNLNKQAVSLAQAGCDVIAPSGNIDGMVFSIRNALNEAGYPDMPILSYAIKYASALYGPFREAAQGKPSFGDRKSYQMDFCNSSEALREAELDIQEGADMLMVKPAGFYLDIIQKIKTRFPEMPLAAYQVSGEYSMLIAAGQNGWLDLEKVMYESLIAIKRAGADFIITYFAKDIIRYLQKNGV